MTTKWVLYSNRGIGIILQRLLTTRHVLPVAIHTTVWSKHSTHSTQWHTYIITHIHLNCLPYQWHTYMYIHTNPTPFNLSFHWNMHWQQHWTNLFFLLSCFSIDWPCLPPFEWAGHANFPPRRPSLLVAIPLPNLFYTMLTDASGSPSAFVPAADRLLDSVRECN